MGSPIWVGIFGKFHFRFPLIFCRPTGAPKGVFNPNGTLVHFIFGPQNFSSQTLGVLEKPLSFGGDTLFFDAAGRLIFGPLTWGPRALFLLGETQQHLSSFRHSQQGSLFLTREVGFILTFPGKTFICGKHTAERGRSFHLSDPLEFFSPFWRFSSQEGP